MPFHRRWIRAVYSPDVEVGVLSCPRGSAKTWVSAQLAALAIRPGSPTWERGVEVLGVSASLEQSRVFLSFVRDALADLEDDYWWRVTGQRLAVTHKATGTRLRILSSSGRRAMGLANFSTIYADEPGSWEVRAVRSCGTRSARRSVSGRASGSSLSGPVRQRSREAGGRT